MSEKKYRILYVISLACVAASVLGGLLCRFFHVNPYHLGWVNDLFLERTGLYCPGCGGSRAVLFFLYGDYAKSILYHPAVMYMVLLFLFYILSYSIYLISRKKIPHMKMVGLYFYVLIGVILGQWILKNSIVLGTGIYYLGVM